MDDFNSIVLEGNIVRDPELRETAKGSTVCLFSIAVNRKFKNSNGERKDEVSFFDIETWGNLATACATYCDKGRGVRIVGRLKQNRWQTEEGKTMSKIRIIAEHIDFKPRFSKPAAEKNAAQNKQEIKDLIEAALADREAGRIDQPEAELCEAVF